MTTRYSVSEEETRTVRVREVAESIQYGHTASAVVRKQGPRFLRITDIQDGKVDWESVPSCDIVAEDVPKYRLSKGDLVFARTGATTGKSFLIRDCPEAVFASYLIRVRASSDVDPRYLALFFQSPDYWQQIERGKRGIGQPNVNGKVLGEVELPLPPLDEQQLIVAEIEKQFTRLDAGVASLKQVQTALKRYRASVLKAACEGRLVLTEAELARKENRSYETGEQLLQRVLKERREKWIGKGKYKEPQPPKKHSYAMVPDGWTVASIEDLSYLDVGFAFKSEEFSESGIRLLRGENIEPGALRWTDTRYWPKSKLDPFRSLLVGEGDIVLAMDRPLISTGLKIARARADDLPCLLVQRMARFRLVDESMVGFLFLALNTEAFRRHLLGGQTGTQLPHISGGQISSFPVLIPPVAEEKRIVDEVERRLSVVNEFEAVLNANLLRAAGFRQSLLARAFANNMRS